MLLTSSHYRFTYYYWLILQLYIVSHYLWYCSISRAFRMNRANLLVRILRLLTFSYHVSSLLMVDSDYCRVHQWYCLFSEQLLLGFWIFIDFTCVSIIRRALHLLHAEAKCIEGKSIIRSELERGILSTPLFLSLLDLLGVLDFFSLFCHFTVGY